MIKRILSKYITTRTNARCKSFENLMHRSKALAEYNNIQGLKDLIRIVLRPIQAEHIRNAYLREPHHAISELFWNDIGIDRNIPEFNESFSTLVWSDLCMVSDLNLYPELNLASDITLPTSWNPTSIVQMLGKIGPGYPSGSFVSSGNHKIIYSYPLCIGWVTGGNHSIIQAILRGEGKVIPTKVHNLSPIINSVCFDGQSWCCKKTETILGKPRYKEFGWVWEIGRLIMDLEENPFTKFTVCQAS